VGGPLDPLALRERCSGCVGIEASLKKQGRSEKVVCIAGDGATFDIGVLCISGAFERVTISPTSATTTRPSMNTGIQRSGATPYGASTTTSPAGACAPGGNPLPKKDMPAILAAHGAPYVATASIAYPNDFIKKVERAINTPGPLLHPGAHSLLHGMGALESGETLAMAKLAIETGLWVNYEMVNGVVEKAKKVRRKPVEEYLAKQKRFRHLFRPARLDAEIAKIQAIADANAERFGIDIKVKEPSE